jgi:hypothetical protein
LPRDIMSHSRALSSVLPVAEQGGAATNVPQTIVLFAVDPDTNKLMFFVDNANGS